MPPSSGYALAVLPSNASLEPGDEDIAISYSQGVIQAVVSIVQIFFATATLYKSRGNQIDQYGYAAFGLSVLPYIIMSIVNLLGNVLTPDFATLYLVRSPEMIEAENRGCLFDGVVGTLVEDTDADEKTYEVKMADDSFQLEAVPSTDIGKRVTHTTSKDQAIEVKAEVPETMFVQGKVATSFMDQILIINESQKAGAVAAENIYQIPPKPSQDNYSLLIPASNHFKTEGSRAWSSLKIMISLAFIIYVMVPIPFAVVAGLTHYHPGHSTHSQRVWMTGWMVFGIFIGAVWPIVVEVYQGTWQDIIDRYAVYAKPLQGSRLLSRVQQPSKLKQLGFNIFLRLSYSAFAIGGWVVVGQMLREYGSCNLLS
jgi:hypothetical protein